LIALIALLAVLGNSRRARRQARQASRGLARGVGAMMLVWLIGGFLAFMALLALLSAVGSGLATNFGYTFVFCLAPGALLVFLGLAAARARERRGAEMPQDRPQITDIEMTPSQTTQQAPVGLPAPDTTRSIDRPISVPRVVAEPRPAKTVRKPLYEPVKNPADYRQRAIGYRRRIQSLIKSRRRGPLSDMMAAILPKLEGWEERVGQLADRLANFETDRLIQRDIKEVPTNIQRMQALWEAEIDPAMRKQIERTLTGYKEQQAQLDALTKLMRRTRFVLDDTLAAIGTVYSQVQVLDAMDIDSTRAAQIGDEIQAQVDRLNDVLSAYAEVNQPAPDEVGDAARRIRLEKRAS